MDWGWMEVQLVLVVGVERRMKKRKEKTSASERRALDDISRDMGS